jgi:hypothetical protein
MTGDPRECRIHAMRCAEAAARANTAHIKATFLGLSKHWEQLARELEKVRAFQDEQNVEFAKSA